MPLNPVVAGMLEQMAAAGGPALSDMSPAEGREMYRAMQPVTGQPELHSVRDAAASGPAGDVPIRIYEPGPGKDRPCLVYFHGGGWVIGDLDTHDGVCRKLAAGTDCVVIATDYRLAPEHACPAALDDCYATVEWAAANATDLGIDPARIAVGGDSAGGHLSACVALRARDTAGPSICYQLLVYPVTDTGFDTVSYEDNKEGYMLTKDSMEWFWNHYLSGSSLARTDPMVAPLQASSHANLPPACVITAEFDPLRDEGEAYGARLREAGVATEITRYDGMIHGFFTMSDVLPDGQAAIDQSCAGLRAAFGG